eukprot:TRINITY_DN4866_c0_g1_i1.p1 TRINITY_DN4866_c0_g1~~TRINITY_DN4866_c0_g1_i1.p1  ORF type:complete len:397 (-),score=26.82 TRINITY_DN4866_c0_g1_i1:367-1557(-)
MASRRTPPWLLLASACASLPFVLGELSRSRAQLTRLPNSTKGRCMDGSPAGYYHFVNSSSSSWLITLGGGGECATKTQCDRRRSFETALTSSKNWNRHGQGITAYFFGQEVEDNPRLRLWNRVVVPYCSQDLWSGQTTEPSEKTWGYYFSGHFVLESVLDALDNVGLKGATDIVLSGCSAGGFGVWLHLDWLAERYPHARVVGAPIAGYYFFADFYTGPGASGPPSSEFLVTDFREEAWPAHFSLWSSFVDQSCAAAIKPWRCLLANYSFPYTANDVFIVQSGVDKIVTLYHDYVPDSHWSDPVYNYFAEWGRNMSLALEPSMAPSSRNGVFAPACFTHAFFTSTHPLIGGKSYLQVFDDWYHNGASAATKLRDSCGIFCNPSCPLPADDADAMFV